MSVVASWYEITLISRLGRNVGNVSQPIPPSIGDMVRVHYNDFASYRVLNREFNYAKGLYVTITLDLD